MQPRSNHRGLFLLMAILVSDLGAVYGQASAAAEEPGIPVRDPLVISKCGGCHLRDERGNMRRISWQRATPEGWQEVIKNMVLQNGLTLTPEEARWKKLGRLFV